MRRAGSTCPRSPSSPDPIGADVAVLVDPLREYPNAGLPLTLWCHLVSDAGFDELHAFAEPGWGSRASTLQGDHYDLNPVLRALGRRGRRP